MFDYRPAVVAILAQHQCFPWLDNHGFVRIATNGSEIWRHRPTNTPILVPVTILSHFAANNVMVHIGVNRIFA
jgi:hypothetical protein